MTCVGRFFGNAEGLVLEIVNQVYKRTLESCQAFAYFRGFHIGPINFENFTIKVHRLE